MSDPTPRQRVDKWLWCARFFKTRSLSASVVTGGKLRVNGERVTKSSHQVGEGDTLTFAQGRRIRVIRVLAPAKRRGPAIEAATLYEDLTPPEDKVPANPRFEGKGRPTKKDRRDGDVTRKGVLE